MEKRGIDQNQICRIGAGMLCAGALLLSGCYYPVQCAALLILFGALFFFLKIGLSKAAVYCFGLCCAGFLISDAVCRSSFQAPVELMKYAFLFFPACIEERSVKKSMLTGIYASCVLLSLIGLFGTAFPAWPIGAGSLIEYENTMAAFSCVGAAVALHAAMEDKEKRFLHGLAFLVCVLMMLLANSIFLYFCVGVALAFVLCLRYKKMRYYVLGAALLVVFGIVFLFLTGREGVLLTSTVASRFIYWYDAAFLALKNPLGIGIYGWENAQYGVQSAIYSVKYVHNSILQLLLDGGVLSAAGFLTFAIFGVVQGVKNYYRQKDKRSLLLLFLILVLILHALFDFDHAYGAYLLVLGVCIALVTQPRSLRFPYVGIALCLVVSFGVGSLCFSSKQPAEVMELGERFRLQYEAGDYERAYETSCQLLTLAPRQQAAYDSAYLSIDKLNEMGYSYTYSGALEELGQRVAEVNASMNPLCKYLDRHKQIVLPVGK